MTETNVDYVGSLTVDRRLLQAADIFPTKVHVVNTNNGSRSLTYVIESERQERSVLTGRRQACGTGR